ncbi:MAG TPA: hypothetical protein VI136_02895 [Verrucomicrobiae bacterium]
MPEEPAIPPWITHAQTDRVPPLLPTARPSALGRQVLAILLSLCLALFLADAVVSLVDDSLILFFGLHWLAPIRGVVFLLAILLALVVYGGMGFTPMIPKRLFLPITLFSPLAALAAIPFVIFCYSRIQQVAWTISLCQFLLGLCILRRVQGGFKFRWPPVAARLLEGRRFSWLNLGAFVFVNVLVLPPAAIVYLWFCTTVAVDHFSEGFVALRPGGLTMQVRTYVRNDGKAIELIPMSHVGESAFYQMVAESFQTNATVMLEGVTDDRGLLTNKITYQRMASSLGLTEQAEEFQPSRGELVHADVDIEVFGTNTIGFLNLIMLVHAKGMSPETVLKLMQYTPPPQFEQQLLKDLLQKRNRHLLGEIQARLPESERILVPWGAAHMPELAREIQKTGFRLDQTREYTVIRFGSAGNKREGISHLKNHGKSQ